MLGKMTKSLLAFSSVLTACVMLFIIFFLFKEGIGLFRSSNIEKGYTLLVHADNPVKELNSFEIKEIFDGKISNWSQVGGKDIEIKPYRIGDYLKEHGEDIPLENLEAELAAYIGQHRHILAFLPEKYAPVFNSSVKELPSHKVSFSDVFGGREWLPASSPAPLFGALPLIGGTLLVSFLAILIALPLGLGVAVYVAELAPVRIKKGMKVVVELLAGIPSVVYGFFGLVVLAPLIQGVFALQIGETALTGGVILAIMALPTIISVAEDALSNTPRALKEGSLALGATQWQTIRQVTFPHARSGIMAAVVLGIGRALGETMAVLMVTGNAAVMPGSIFESVRTIPATIAAELGESSTGGTHYQALFLLGALLFVVTMLTSVLADIVTRKQVKS